MLVKGRNDLKQYNHYYGLLTDFYFDGDPTETTIPIENVDT